MSNQPAAVMIAGTSSGSGKTTASLVLMDALKRRGFDVAPFKAGPDYIDPGYHALLCGRSSSNLDMWLMPENEVRKLFHQRIRPNKFAVIEGVMGLYDGIPGTSSFSSAHLAKMLNVPVVLVIDGSKMADSAAAMALGFKQYDPQVNITGVLFNNISSDRHYKILKEALEGIGLTSFGYLPRQTNISVEERHLGLKSVHEQKSEFTGALKSFAESASKTMDIELIVDRSMNFRTEYESAEAERSLAKRQAQEKYIVKIAVARDEAFCFYYQDSLDALKSKGAELAYFSPIRDKALPKGASGIIFGGGFPEMFASELEANREIIRDIRDKANEGIPIYAECGGLAYMAKGLFTSNGKIYEMTGLINIDVKMNDKRQSLGYVEARLLEDCIIGGKGAIYRGHKFHWSSAQALGTVQSAYSVHKNGSPVVLDGFTQGNIFASYVHLHFSGCPGAADKFLTSCKIYTKQGVSL